MPLRVDANCDNPYHHGMKFGFESEKLLYDLKDDSIFHGVFRLVDALSDYVTFHGEDVPERVTNEFVLNMVEINTLASPSQREVIEDYLLLYQIVTDVSYRERVVPLPLGAVPFLFTPNMVPRWPYYVQNSILSGKRLKDWALSPKSPLADAGNCAGLHTHIEIECLPEFLVFSKELVHKHNMGLMLTPMTAFSASPYFYEEHSAHSMRAHRYYHRVYEKFPLNGALPPVMSTSEEVLRYTLSGINHWIEAGTQIGFDREDLVKLTSKKGANWSMIRWNRTWNTIELRCLESDRVDLDIGKFIWVAGAMKRLDLKGEALEPEVLTTQSRLDEKMIDEAFNVHGGRVSILPTVAIHELTSRAILKGLHDPWVERYLHRLATFARDGVDENCLSVFEILKKALDSRRTTTIDILEATGNASSLTQQQCIPILRDLIQKERTALAALRTEFPNVIFKKKSDLFPRLPKK
ncbi:MAG: hypothetical protein AB7P04_15220 [Bacteriovoracia bacterium]